MKNKIYLSLVIFFSIVFENSNAENISIIAKNISIDKNDNSTVFEDEVMVKTQNKTIKGEYAKYDRENGYLIIKENIIIIDENNNKLFTDFAEYFEKEQIFKTRGKTKIETEEKYFLEGENLLIDNKKKIISSQKKSVLEDQDGNRIFINNFQYHLIESLFKSIGNIEIEDAKKNKYEFSQIFIDTKKKQIFGTDSKSYLNDPNFKINLKNNPRIFSNSININKEKSTFEKSVFTLCQYRDNDDCPPWTIQSKKMLHDNIKKTIYYDNAVVKVYDIPIFYFPKLSHPDPSVKRRTGFLVPSIYDTKNLGSGISIPYFFDLGVDKNLTFTNRLYVDENPLFLGEYHQAFQNSSLITDFGYTSGYKKTNSKKRAGEKSHVFAKFIKSFKDENNFESSLELNFQEVSNDKYLKLYKIDSNLVDYNIETLESSIKFNHERDDLFFGINTSVYETLKSNYDDKYEYILPEITLDKNLFYDENLGRLDIQTNYTVNNYDTNKLTNFLVNDFNYESNNKILNDVFNTKVLVNLKNINYESKNVDIYKEDFTSELFGSFGLLSEIKFQKFKENWKHFLTPKILARYAPGSMRKEKSGNKLTSSNAFEMNRISNINNYETGFSGTLGVNYKIKDKDLDKFDFSVAQIINEKENKMMSDKSSLNEKISDLVGESTYTLSDNLKLKYNFALDQNYKDFNYNEFGTSYNNGPFNIDFNYLSEDKHIGNQDYFKAKLNVKNKDKGLFSFSTKRNLITNSSEFYDLSYEYINDCLRAGLVYRREFYNDSEIDSENSLMFKVTLVPFGSIESPKLEK